MDKRKILIVDDDLITLKMLNKLLEKEGFSTTTSESAERALKILEEEADNYFLILSDYNMPGKTGLDLLKNVKELYTKVELIMITGAGSEDVAVKVLRLGAMDYIKKPIIRDELLAIVHKASEMDRLRRQNLEYFNEILHLRDMTDIEIESFKLFIKGMQEDLLESYSYIERAYIFLKKLELIKLSPDLKKDLENLLNYFSREASKLKKF